MVTTTKEIAGETKAVTVDMLLMLFEERDKQYQNQLLHLKEAVGSLKEAIALALAGQEKAVAAALAAAKEAVTKAEIANEKRFDSVNEFRKALSDLTSLFIRKSEAELNFKNLESLIKELTVRVSAINDKQIQGSGKIEGAHALWFGLGAFILLAIGVANFIMK